MMRRLETLFLIALALSILGVGTYAQKQEPPPQSVEVTLDEALAQALQGNALLQAAREDVKAKEGQAKEAHSYYLPSLAFTENYSRTNNPVYVFMGKLTQANFQMSDFYLPSLNNPEPLTNFQSRAELVMPLFTGGKVNAAYRATRLGVEAARDNSAFAESGVVKAVTEAFYGSLLASKAAQVYDETVKTAEAHLAQVEAMHKEGLVLDSDLLRIRVFVSDMKQQRASREADAQVARAYLAYAMGYSGDVEPRGDFVPPESQVPSLSEAQKAALESRGDLQAVSAQTKQAAEGVKMSRADYMPQVGLMASYEQDTQRWSPGAWGDNWMLGIQLRIPLFDGGARSGRLQTAKAQETMAQKALLDLEQKALVEVKSAWLKAQSAAQRVDVTAESEAQARENQRIVALRYQEGLAALTDLLDADTALTAAALSRSQAIHDELVERAHLTWATGK
jgi:outer membrane protein TolC